MLLVIAVQRIRSTVNERDQKQLLMDLDVVMRSNECPYIVKFYGALFKEVCFADCWFLHNSENLWNWFDSYVRLSWSECVESDDSANLIKHCMTMEVDERYKRWRGSSKI